MAQKNILFFLTFILVNYTHLFGWVFPEHRDIALRAMQTLAPEKRQQLDSLWQIARKGYEHRLSETVFMADQSRNPQHLDFATWPAIAGDHSCSPEEMLHNILETDWILDVADISAQLWIDLNTYNSGDIHEVVNALRNSDLLLQRADPDYATRAGSNNVHFLLALPDMSLDLKTYLQSCILEGAELNAIGAYALFHHRALEKLTRINSNNLSQIDKTSLMLAALADEAFALHFLQDTFAAGHIAGTHGDASQRKGTHDYYNEHGLRVSTWEGENFVFMGDAYMRDSDAIQAAQIVQLSLIHLLEAADGKYDHMFSRDKQDNQLVDDFNVCTENNVPQLTLSSEYMSMLEKIVGKTPIPGLANGGGELPRFRAELGLFAGFAPTVNGTYLSRAFGKQQNYSGFTGGIEAAVRIGFGLDGVLNEAGDGLIFLSFGVRQDGSSSSGAIDADELQNYGAILSAIPA